MVDTFYIKSLTRRNFLKRSLKTLAVSGAVMGYESIIGCAPVLKEGTQDVLDQKWEANSIIPVPKEGCYTGLSKFSPQISIEDYERNISRFIEEYTDQILKPPSIYAVSATFVLRCSNENFPTYRCVATNSKKAIPLIKYQVEPFRNFEEITAGKFDKEIKEFAVKAKEYGRPYFFVPFAEANSEKVTGVPFGSQSPNKFKEAFAYMHRIFRELGANQNTLWVASFYGTHGGHTLHVIPFHTFYPGDEYVDWIGFVVHNKTAFTPYFDFYYLFEDDYNWVRKNHPSKSIILVEFGKTNDWNQPRWIRLAFKAMKEKFPAVKAFLWWDISMREGGNLFDQGFSRNPKSIMEIQKALKDSYFLGSILSLEKKEQESSIFA